MAFVISDSRVTITTASGIARTIEGLDSVGITNARERTIVYSADDTDTFGVKSTVGVSDPDEAIITITSLREEYAIFLNDIYDNNERVNLTIIDQNNNNKKYFLQNAVYANRIKQTSIDSDAASKLVITFRGRWGKGIVYNTEEVV